MILISEGIVAKYKIMDRSVLGGIGTQKLEQHSPNTAYTVKALIDGTLRTEVRIFKCYSFRFW